MHLLLSTALPEDEELEDILKGATYSLLKRSGFIDSQTYAAQQMRKSDIYVFSAGSCFVNTFKGKVIEERNGGTHPIFRYAKAFSWGYKNGTEIKNISDTVDCERSGIHR